MPAGARPHGVGFGEALRVWARVAALSFGGPAGQIAVMHRILVEEKRWIGEARFLHALNYCMLLPGPEAQQLATYVGWLMHGAKGGLAAGLLFILPGAVAIMALSWIYAAFGDAAPVEALFFGLKAAVAAIVLQAVFRIGGRAIRNPAMAGIAAAAFVAIFAFDVPFPLIVLGAALIGFAGAGAGLAAFGDGAGDGAGAGGGPTTTRPADTGSLLGEGMPGHARPALGAWKAAAACLVLWLAPVLALWLALGPDDVFTRIAVFFSKMAVVTFGGAYAILAYVAQQAVEVHGWLAPGEMLDGLGLAETTPGPLIMVTQFVGFMGALREPGRLPPLLAGMLGGLLTTWVTFAPSFLWIFLGAPFAEALRGNRALGAALSAVTASVVGVIVNLALWFALHLLFAETVGFRRFGMVLEVPVPASLDPAALALAAGAMIAMFGFGAGVFPTLAACACAGLLLHWLAFPVGYF